MSKHDGFIQQQLSTRLYPGETILATGTLNTKDFKKFLLMGMWALVGDGHYFAAVTQQRLVLIATSMGPTGIKMVNNGISEIPCAEIASVQTTSGMVEKTLNLSMRNGSTLTYNLNSLPNVKDGQKAFVDTLNSVVMGGPQNAMYATPAAGPPPPPPPGSQPSTPQPAAPAAPGMSIADQIKELATLYQAGVLTEEEYNSTKADLLKKF